MICEEAGKNEDMISEDVLRYELINLLLYLNNSDHQQKFH